MAAPNVDIRHAAIQLSPSRRPTVNLRKRELAVERLSQCSNLSWCTGETLSNVPHAAGSCVGALLMVLFIRCLFLKWRKYKGTHPVALRYAFHGAAACDRVASRVSKVYRKKRRSLERKYFRMKLWCIVYYYLVYGKATRAWVKCRYKVVNRVSCLVDRLKTAYLRMAVRVYRYAPIIKLSTLVIFLYLILSGDIELNPGPKHGRLTIDDDLNLVQAALWNARTKWFNIGIQLKMNITDLEEIEQTYMGKAGECITRLLIKWLRRKSPIPTWNAILAALRSPPVGLSQMADEIENGDSDSEIELIGSKIGESYSTEDASLLLKAAHTGDMDEVVRLVEEEKHNPYQKVRGATRVLVGVANSRQIGISDRIRERMMKIARAAETQLEESLSISQARERALQKRVEEAEAEGRELDRRTTGRLREVEQQLVQCEGRARQAEALVQQNQEECHWLVQQREIDLTEEERGRGGWAAVKVANFRGTRVAAKCFYQQILVSRYNQQLFNREMNMAARLRHPNLVQFIGASLEGEPIILMELMATSLRSELEMGPIDLAHVTSISLDVVRALNYLHLMQPHPIIHRDVSSANVLLDPLPDNHWKAKLSDYGSVNLIRELRTVGPGSPVYAAPEVHIPAHQSPKMDIFSFGVLLVEMLTDEFPQVDARQRLIDSINQAGYVDLIGRCLREEREDRPSANEIIANITNM